jgi:hypothetical protein
MAVSNISAEDGGPARTNMGHRSPSLILRKRWFAQLARQEKLDFDRQASSDAKNYLTSGFFDPCFKLELVVAQVTSFTA